MVSDAASAAMPAYRDAHEVVGREGVELHREFGAAKWGELVGMEVDPPAESVGVGENSSGLVEVEHADLAEHVDRFCEAAAGNARVNFFHQLT